MSSEFLSDMDIKEKRIAKCPGCKTPIEEHQWGIPSKFCEGFEKCSPKKEIKGATPHEEENVMVTLSEELKSLELEEQLLRRQKEEESLRHKITEKRKAIKELQQRKQPAEDDRARTFTTKDLKQLEPDGVQSGQTPLDEILSAINPLQEPPLNTTWSTHVQQASLVHPGAQSSQAWPQAAPQAWQGPPSNATEMFLKPGKMPKGEKPLLIIDFVNNIVPQDEEETLGNQGHAKIVVTYGPKKPKLENINMQQWVVANTRIFYTLLSEGKLISHVDIQNYLAYTVKIMELSSKYEWRSILMYDNEFRKLQAVYNFQWSFDSPHLHTVMLQPIFKANAFTNSTKPPPTNPRSAFATFTSEGKVICRNFNGQRGCMLHNCNFAHVCNRKVAGKSCGLSHPGHSHRPVDPNTQPIS